MEQAEKQHFHADFRISQFDILDRLDQDLGFHPGIVLVDLSVAVLVDPVARDLDRHGVACAVEGRAILRDRERPHPVPVDVEERRMIPLPPSIHRGQLELAVIGAHETARPVGVSRM